MRLLDACLALVLTLAVFASSVTVLVEALHFLLDSRAKALKGMLDAVFERALDEGEVRQQLASDPQQLAALRQNFFEVLGTSRTLTQLEARNGLAGKLARGALGLLRKHSATLGAVYRVSLPDALRRLGRTELAETFGDKKEILAKLQASLDARYARFEQSASEYFRDKSRNLAFIVGIFLAVTVNVDAVRMFDAFLADPALTAQTIARMQAEQKISAENAAAATNQSPEEKVRDALVWAETSRSAGFPVGWAYFPYCTPPGAQQVDLRCLDEKGQTKSLRQRFWPGEQVAGKPFLAQAQVGGQGTLWLISAIVTGLLIGLGGPFWFDLAASLGRLRELLRGTGKEKSETQK